MAEKGKKSETQGKRKVREDDVEAHQSHRGTVRGSHRGTVRGKK